MTVPLQESCYGSDFVFEAFSLPFLVDVDSSLSQIVRLSLTGSSQPFWVHEPLPWLSLIFYLSDLSVLAAVFLSSMDFEGQIWPEVDFPALEAGERIKLDVPGFFPIGIPALEVDGDFLPEGAGFSPMVCAASASGEDITPPCMLRFHFYWIVCLCTHGLHEGLINQGWGSNLGWAYICIWSFWEGW